VLTYIINLIIYYSSTSWCLPSRTLQNLIFAVCKVTNVFTFNKSVFYFLHLFMCSLWLSQLLSLTSQQRPQTFLYMKIDIPSVYIYIYIYIKYIHIYMYMHVYTNVCGPGSSVGIATVYGLDDPGSNPCEVEIFRPSRPALGAHPASCKMDTGSFQGVKCGRGVLLTTHPLLVPQSWKSRAIPLPTFWATPGL